MSYRVPATVLALMLGLFTSACTPFQHRAEVAAYEPPTPAPVETLDSQVADAPESEVESTIPAAAARQLLIGKWYGQMMENGTRKEWLIERAVDGTYRADYLATAADGEQKFQSEVGFWGTSGGVYFRIFRGWAGISGMKIANPGRAEYYDAYKIISLDREQMHYQHLENGREYAVRKMPLDFRLPVALRPAPQPEQPTRLVF